MSIRELAVAVMRERAKGASISGSLRKVAKCHGWGAAALGSALRAAHYYDVVKPFPAGAEYFSPVTTLIYRLTGTGRLLVWDGKQWQDASTESGVERRLTSFERLNEQAPVAQEG